MWVGRAVLAQSDRTFPVPQRPSLAAPASSAAIASSHSSGSTRSARELAEPTITPSALDPASSRRSQFRGGQRCSAPGWHRRQHQHQHHQQRRGGGEAARYDARLTSPRLAGPSYVVVCAAASLTGSAEEVAKLRLTSRGSLRPGSRRSRSLPPIRRRPAPQRPPRLRCRSRYGTPRRRPPARARQTGPVRRARRMAPAGRPGAR